MSAEDLRGRPHGDPKEAIDAVASPYEVLEIQTPPFHSKFSMDFGEHRIIGPDGREEVRLVTTFPQMATMTFPYTEDGFVLIEEDTYVAGPKLEAPGGVIKLDDPQEAALMIVKGETGIEFVPDSITEAVRYQTSAANTDNKTFLSSGLVARIGEQDPETTATIRLRNVSFDEALDRVVNDELPYEQRINTGSVVLGVLLTLDRIAQERGLDFSSHMKQIFPPQGWVLHFRAPAWKSTASQESRLQFPPHLPYSLVSREILRERDDETQRVQLIHDTVTIEGNTKDQFWINQPDHVRIIPIDEDSNIYLGLLPNYPYNINWPVMAGESVGDDDTYAQAAQRAAGNIFGVDINAKQLCKLADFEEVTSRMRVKEKVIAARINAGDLEGVENIVKLSLQEAWQMVKDGQVQATTTATAIGLLQYKKPIFG
ncbi:MAG: hypothetical protein A3A51_01455 [Candidatus Levybacteria bacterium RIFCSPLOWO2_01_FULL_39_10]|nr:MAG: hypothetical protein A3A51_01455 [Candidatus Levybacteria bacterium RIFCSPLOWO2_01_FULL_39_10]